MRSLWLGRPYWSDPPAAGLKVSGQGCRKPITTIVLTNRDHVRDTELFRTRYGAHVTAGKNELAQLAPLTIDVAVQEGDLIFRGTPGY